MAESGIFRINPLQGWQRDAILKAAQLLRDRFGEDDDQSRLARDGLFEVLDPARRTARLQKELSEATRAAAPVKIERRQRERRGPERRNAAAGPAPDQPERRRRERRTTERRNKR